MITLNGPSSKRQPRNRSGNRLETRIASRNRSDFEKARKELKGLSDKKLLSDLDILNRKERGLQITLLLYLSELDKRKLYLPLAFSSLFDFCTYHLGYTRATAVRRIRAARAVAEYPEALDMLNAGEINITTLSMIADILDQDNHGHILPEIKNKSTRRVELLISRHRPERMTRDMIRPVCVMRRIDDLARNADSNEDNLSTAGSPASSTEVRLLDRVPSAGDERRKSSKISSSAGTNIMLTKSQQAEQSLSSGDDEGRKSNKISPSAEPESRPGRSEKTIFEERLKLGFTVSPEFMNKFNKIKSLLSGRHPEWLNFETLFEILMNDYLDRHDPDLRRKRRARRSTGLSKASQQGSEKNSREKADQPGELNKNRKESSAKPPRAARQGFEPSRSNSRHIPPTVRDRVYARDRGRCTFIGANGKRCNSTWDLEIDHIVPYAQGGNNSPENLRLLCRKHNIYLAERFYGKEHMNKFR